MKQKFIKSYISKLNNTLTKINPEDIEKIIDQLTRCHETNGRIFIIGNGGSAATASHMANDLGVGLKRRNIMNIDVQSLADNSAVFTAAANDIGFENTFYIQLENVINKNDLLIAISCSGNSPNIIKAVEYAKKIGATIVGCTGFDGGQLRPLSDINFHVPSETGDYGIVEDIHMILDHIIYSYFIENGI